ERPAILSVSASRPFSSFEGALSLLSGNFIPSMLFFIKFKTSFNYQLIPHKIMLFSNIKKPFKCLVIMMMDISSFSALKTQAQDKSVQLFAHRAGAHEQDENTLQAFQNTYDQGLRGFETDIRMTQDGELVIFHDASLDRITGQQGIVEEMTAA